MVRVSCEVGSPSVDTGNLLVNFSGKRYPGWDNFVVIDLVKGNQVDVRAYHFFFKHINRSKLDPGREIFALRDTPHSRVRGSDDGAQAVPYPLPRLAVGVGICL